MSEEELLDERVVGMRPKPRVLLAWADEEDDPAAFLEGLGLEVRRIENLGRVHQLDYDVLVVDDFMELWRSEQSWEIAADHLHVITFARGGSAAQEVDRWANDDGNNVAIQADVGDLSERFSISRALPDSVAELLDDTLLPELQRLPRQHQFFATVQRKGATWRLATNLVVPFITSSAGNVLAGSYQRGVGAEGWVLPHTTPAKNRWILAALRAWAASAGWPPPGNWRENKRWRTAPERVALDAIADVGRRRDVALAALAAEESAANLALTSAEAAATAGERRLLEAKGEGFAVAVGEAFRALGYDVVDMDAITPKGDRREDFRLIDPDGGATYLVEAKGYDRGVRALDLRNISRHADRARFDGIEIAGAWWVANHDRLLDPSVRPPALQNEQDALDEDAADYGLVFIESSLLFESLQQVHGGAVDAATVRRSLRDAAARWTGVAPDATV